MLNRTPAKRVLCLRAEGLSGRAIAASQAVAGKSATAVIEAAHRLGEGWDDVAERDDAEVYALLLPDRGEHHSVFVQPYWSAVHADGQGRCHAETAAWRVHRQGVLRVWCRDELRPVLPEI